LISQSVGFVGNMLFNIQVNKVKNTLSAKKLEKFGQPLKRLDLNF